MGNGASGLWLQMKTAEKRHAFLQVQGQIPTPESTVKSGGKTYKLLWPGRVWGLLRKAGPLALLQSARAPNQAQRAGKRSPEDPDDNHTGLQAAGSCLWGRHIEAPGSSDTWLGWDEGSICFEARTN